MKNNTMLRAKRWTKYLISYIYERLHGLDFSMAYAGKLQMDSEEFNGYCMTDTKDMMRMLRAVPIDPSRATFLDVGCGKGMCLKCAVEIGYQKVAGLELDPHLAAIARKNMEKLKMDAECICSDAVDFSSYADYDVFYFYNPFGEFILEKVIQKIKDSQKRRNRQIWIIYYHPVFGALFDRAGFVLKSEVGDTTRNMTTRVYCYPKRS